MRNIGGSCSGDGCRGDNGGGTDCNGIGGDDGSCGTGYYRISRDDGCG
jgi:hypothetical protein